MPIISDSILTSQSRLSSLNEDYLEKEIEHEKQLTQLEEEKEQLKVKIKLVIQPFW